MAGTQAPVVHAAPAAAGSTVAQAPIVGWTALTVLQPIASAKPACDDAICNQWCIDQGGAFGYSRGNGSLRVCGICGSAERALSHAEIGPSGSCGQLHASLRAGGYTASSNVVRALRQIWNLWAR